MLKRKILLLIIPLLALTLQAQKLTVESMKALPMDLSASQYERKDLAGKPCALVKVQLAATGAQFEGNVIGKADYKTNEYWVYMSEGSYMLSIKHPSFVTLSVNFRDYGINGVQGKATYQLTVLMPQEGGVVQTQKLIINYSPISAMVLIDSKLYKGNGHIETKLPVGTHQYIIAADGYATAEATVKLTPEAPRTVTEYLVAIQQAAKVNTDDKQVIAELFATYFTALAKLDEVNLSLTLPPVLNSFLHKANATKSDVIQYMNRIHEPDVLQMQYILNNDWKINKTEIKDGQFEYSVEFSVDQKMDRSDESKERFISYKVQAKVSPEYKITDLNMKKIVQ